MFCKKCGHKMDELHDFNLCIELYICPKCKFRHFIQKKPIIGSTKTFGTPLEGITNPF